MVASILDGKAIAAAVRQRVSRRVAERASVRRPRPGLAVILVGDDPASAIYVRAKHADCIEVGMHCEVHRLDASITPEALGERIDTLNTDPDVHGIILQLPLPAHLDDAGFIERIRESCRLAAFSASIGMSACAIFSRRISISSSSSASPSSRRIAFICWRRRNSRCERDISSWTIVEISFLTSWTCAWRPTRSPTFLYPCRSS